MNTITAAFRRRMAEVATWVDLVGLLTDLAREDIRRLRSSVPAADRARAVHRSVGALGNVTTIVAYEGAYLTACAEFELAVRAVVEKFVDQVNSRIPTFTSLPAKIQGHQYRGCARVIMNIGEDKFSHLTAEQVAACMHSCGAGLAAGYRLLPEAFSENRNNFDWKMMGEVMGRLGVPHFSAAMGNDVALSALLGTTVGGPTENVAAMRLNNAMKRRNQVIHRGRSTYNPSESDGKQCAEFFVALVDALASILAAYLLTL
jgi:hypothetical protein